MHHVWPQGLLDLLTIELPDTLSGDAGDAAVWHGVGLADLPVWVEGRRMDALQGRSPIGAAVSPEIKPRLNCGISGRALRVGDCLPPADGQCDFRWSLCERL